MHIFSRTKSTQVVGSQALIIHLLPVGVNKIQKQTYLPPVYTNND